MDAEKIDHPPLETIDLRGKLPAFTRIGGHALVFVLTRDLLGEFRLDLLQLFPCGPKSGRSLAGFIEPLLDLRLRLDCLFQGRQPVSQTG